MRAPSLCRMSPHHHWNSPGVPREGGGVGPVGRQPDVPDHLCGPGGGSAAGDVAEQTRVRVLTDLDQQLLLQSCNSTATQRWRMRCLAKGH